tara:strand:+ start:619 stop:1791 length:1173 start_codon:yes stop_codon:yes gene_type:complete
MKSKDINNEIGEIIKGFDVAYGKAVAPFNEWLLIELKNLNGRTINQVINEGWIKFNVADFISESVYATTMASASVKILSLDPEAIIDSVKLKSTIKFKPWASDKRSLNSRMKIANTSTRKYIAESVKADFSIVRKYDLNLKKINAQILTNGKIDESILRAEVRSLTSDIRKLGINGDYEKELKLLESRIKRLSEMDYPTSDTKKAYKSFIKGVKSKNIEAFEKSVTEAVKKKSRYISRRIARTEQARASLDSYLLMHQDDDDVVGYRWRLSASHKIYDICDINASADFGLGKGVYPKDKLPQIPAHPQCRCYLTPVIEGDMPNPDNFDYSKGGDNLIKNLPIKKQNIVLGSVARGEAFRDGANWDSVSVNKPKPQDLKTRFENVIESKFL